MWASVRQVLRHDDGGPPLYEERITVWQAEDLDAAIAAAEGEVAEHCAALGCVDTGLYQAYALPAELDGVESGAEVFSLMRASSLSPDKYVATFFDTGEELQQRGPAR